MVPPMIAAVFAILACQLTGEVISRSLHLSVPGPVLGMALMLICLASSARIRQTVRPVAETILGNLLLLFVPAGVGAALQLPQLGLSAWPLILAVMVSTLLAIAVGALTFVAVARWTDRDGSEASHE